jgi:soluble lytic murein transglycosylase-like protein
MGRIYDRGTIVRLILQNARKYGIDPVVGVSQIIQEGSMDQCRTSPAGAVGVAQFMPGTARRFSLEDRCDPVASLDAWGQYMSYLLGMFRGRYDLALAGYNWGENRAALKRGDLTTAPKQTKDYVRLILGTPAHGTQRPAEARALIAQYAPSVGRPVVQTAGVPGRSSGLLPALLIGGVIFGYFYAHHQ